MTSLSIIIVSSGRPTLAHAIESARSQMRDGDESLTSIQTDCPWGNAARNQLMACARGDAILFMDDDDEYAPGALDIVRAAWDAHPHHLHIFRMRYNDGRELWTDRQIRCGNVSTQMVLAPRQDVLPSWGDRYEGDFDFIAACDAKFGPAVFHEDVIAHIRPAR